MRTRTVLFILPLLLIAVSLNAQIKPFAFGVYGEALMRTEALKDRTNNGFGGGLDFQFRLPVKISVTGSAGLLHFAEKDLTSTTKVPEENMAIVRAGAKYRINLLYIKMESGAAIPLENGKTLAILSPGLGVKFSAIDIQAKYEVWLDEVNREFYGIKLGIFF